MTQTQTHFHSAQAGLTYALGDWWPGAPPSTPEVIMAAERLAAGDTAPETATPQALRSLADRLSGWQGGPTYHHLLPLDLAPERLYPVGLQNVQGNLAGLRQQFVAAAGQVSSADPRAHLENLLDLLQQYAWSVPAARYGPDSDVSLYDHARITAALAVCLADGGDPAGPVGLLVGGDLSGVQDWLYTLASSGAAKSLRGRSFYLQLLTEVVAYKVLDDLALPLTNLVYAGGGNFYLLAPLNAALRIRTIAAEIGAALLAAHAGDLYLAVDCTELTAADLKMGAVGAAWGRVTSALGLQKRHRFANLGEASMAQAIGVAMHSGGSPDKVCNVCQRENPTGKEWEETEAGVRKCGLCASFETLGNTLPRTSHIVVTRLAAAVPPSHPVNDWHDGLAALGYAVDIVDDYTSTARPVAEAEFARIGRNRPASDAQADRPVVSAFAGVPHAELYRPLVDIVPWVNGTIATFDELCNLSSNLQRWGVLRLDVDDLGKLFQEGLGDRATLTRTTRLSFALRLFFEGRLNAIGDEWNLAHPEVTPATLRPAAELGKDKVYAMYSGGDDLFIVGAWDALPHLARAIRIEFGKFFSGNPNLTLSGGISLATEKYPLYQAARQAGAAESAAKHFKRPDGREKDALSFLGQVIGWEQFDRIWADVAQLQSWVAAKKINRCLIQGLRAIDGEYQWGLRERRRQRAQHGTGRAGQFYYGPWLWMLVYQLSRVAEMNKHEDVRLWVKNLRDELVKPDGPITVLGLIARWAEFLTRKGKSAED